MIERSFIDLLNSREPEAFKTLFNRYYARLLKFSLSYLPCESDGEDVIQDVVVSLWKGRACFLDEKQLLAYLFKSVKSRSISALRRKNRTILSANFSEEYGYVEGGELDNYWDSNRELVALFDQSLAQLPKECRKIFSHILGGLSTVEIALKLQKASSTVRAQKRRGIAIMKEYVREQQLYQEIMEQS